MVTPPDKEGAPVEALTREGGIILASEDGNKLTYVVDGALGEDVEGNRSPEWQQILATRGSDATGARQDIATPSSKAKGVTAGQAPEYQFFTPDLVDRARRTGWSERAEPPLAPGVTQATMYLRDNATGTFLPLVTEANTAPGTQFGGQVHFVSATPDLSHVVLTSDVALTGRRLGAGPVRVVGGPAAVRQRAARRERRRPTAGTRLLQVACSPTRSPTTARGSSGPTKEELDTRGATSTCATPPRAKRSSWTPRRASPNRQKARRSSRRASSDGSRVFFTDKQRLTADSTAEPGQGTGKPDLYECEIVEEAGKLACHLQGSDGRSQRRRARGRAGLHLRRKRRRLERLPRRPGRAGGQRKRQRRNGRSRARTTSTSCTSTARSGRRRSSRRSRAKTARSGKATRSPTRAFLTARVSPNGRYLAFMSRGADHRLRQRRREPGSERRARRGGLPLRLGHREPALRLVQPDRRATDRRARPRTNPAKASGCSSTGARSGLNGREHWLAGNIPGWTAQSLDERPVPVALPLRRRAPVLQQPRRARAGGDEPQRERLSSTSPRASAAAKAPPAAASSLLSVGTSDRESAFIEATPDGSDVFFVTESKLLPQDTDTAFDIYDARDMHEPSRRA